MKFKGLFWIVTIVSFFLLTSSSLAALTDNAWAYYSFDNSNLSASNPLDLTGNGRTGTNVQAGVGATGIIDESFTYNGTSSRVLVAGGTYNAAFAENSDWGFSAWINTDTLSPGANKIVFGIGTGTSNIGSSVFIRDSQIRAASYTGTGFRFSNSTTITTGTWYHVVFNHKASGSHTLYVNGVAATTSNALARVGNKDHFFIGAFKDGAAAAGDFWDGEIDEVLFRANTTFSQAEVTQLYNSGLGNNPYSPSATSSNYSITVIDQWNSSSVNNITVVVDGETFFNTTGNIVYTNVTVNTSSLHTVHVSAQDYFNKGFSNQNLSNSSVLSIFQTVVSFSGYELITGNSLGNTGFTVGAQTNGTFYLKAGTYTVTGFKDGYYNKNLNFSVAPLFNGTVNVTGMYNTLLNISLTNGVGGASINNVTGWYYNSINTFNQSFSNNNIPIVSGLNYTLFVNPQGYNTNTSVINISSGVRTYNYSISLFTYNTFSLSFFDSNDGLIINDRTITFDLISTVFSNSYTTSNGTLIISLLTPSDYTFRYSAPSYYTNYYFTTLLNDTYQNITLYLSNSSIVENITIEVIDTSAAVVENAIVNAQQLFLSSNSYLTVASGETNTEGETLLSLVKYTEYYKFQVVYEGRVVKLTNPFIITKNTLRIQVDLEENNYLNNWNQYKGISSSLVFNRATDSFRMDFNSPTTYEFCLETYRRGVTSDTLLNNTCNTASSGSIIHQVGNVSGRAYYSKALVTINNEQYLLSTESYIYPVVDLDTKGLFGQILLTIVFSLAGFIGVELILISAPMSLIVGGFIGLHNLGLYYTVPLLIVGIFISVLLRKNNG